MGGVARRGGGAAVVHHNERAGFERDQRGQADERGIRAVGDAGPAVVEGSLPANFKVEQCDEQERCPGDESRIKPIGHRGLAPAQTSDLDTGTIGRNHREPGVRIFGRHVFRRLVGQGWIDRVEDLAAEQLDAAVLGFVAIVPFGEKAAVPPHPFVPEAGRERAIVLTNGVMSFIAGAGDVGFGKNAERRAGNATDSTTGARN